MVFIICIPGPAFSSTTFLPRCMEYRRGIAMKILSIRLSVCQTRAFMAATVIDYLKAEKYVGLYSVVNSKQNMKLQQKQR